MRAGPPASPAGLQAHAPARVPHARDDSGPGGTALGEHHRRLLEVDVGRRRRRQGGQEGEKSGARVMGFRGLDRDRGLSYAVLPPAPEKRVVMTSVDDDGIRHALLQLLEANPPDEEKLLARFESQRRDGQAVYSAILYILTHLSFSETEAERHWRRIRRHREALRKDLHRDVGLRVALLDYFVNVSRELKNPKVIEISIYERTARSAVTDGLTGLFNHEYFVTALRREMQRCKRHDLKLSLVMLDLDDFKAINDTYGHLEGDRVLMKSATLVSESLREIDIAARYGGEEFAVILPDTPRTGAFVVADRIRRRVEEHFRRRKEGPRVTLSGGVATFPDDAADLEQLITRADEALYRSKAQGKNRVTMIGGERRQHTRVSGHPSRDGERRRPRGRRPRPEPLRGRPARLGRQARPGRQPPRRHATAARWRARRRARRSGPRRAARRDRARALRPRPPLPRRPRQSAAPPAPPPHIGRVAGPAVPTPLQW